jgi:hypothetical protein
VTALGVSTVAQAGWLVEGSIGKGVRLTPSPLKATQSNIMIAPGYSVPFLRFELGFLFELPDAERGKADVEIRPMLVLAPPVIPFYGRLMVLVLHDNLLSKPVGIGYGVSGGFKMGLGPVVFFAEAGTIPKRADAQTILALEGRVGGLLEF